jgi:hypothetical protein
MQVAPVAVPAADRYRSWPRAAVHCLVLGDAGAIGVLRINVTYNIKILAGARGRDI